MLAPSGQLCGHVQACQVEVPNQCGRPHCVVPPWPHHAGRPGAMQAGSACVLACMHARIALMELLGTFAEHCMPHDSSTCAAGTTRDEPCGYTTALAANLSSTVALAAPSLRWLRGRPAGCSTAAATLAGRRLANSLLSPRSIPYVLHCAMCIVLGRCLLASGGSPSPSTRLATTPGCPNLQLCMRCLFERRRTASSSSSGHLGSSITTARWSTASTCCSSTPRLSSPCSRS